MHSKFFSLTNLSALFVLSVGTLTAETDCNCAETEVRFTASIGLKSELGTTGGEVGTLLGGDSGAGSALYSVDDVEHQGTHLEHMQEDVAVTLKAEEEYLPGSEDIVIVRFPHCTMEYKAEGDTEWTEGTSVSFCLSEDTNGDTVITPASVQVRFTLPPSDEAEEPAGSEEEDGDTMTVTPPEVSHDPNDLADPFDVQPSGLGISLSLGSARDQATDMYRSAGQLANYGSVSTSFTEPNSFSLNSLAEIAAQGSVYEERIPQDVNLPITEKRIIAPDVVFRIRGWNGTTDVSYNGAAETVVEVYDPSLYSPNAPFLGDPHSRFIFEQTSSNNGFSGVKYTREVKGLVRTETYEVAGNQLRHRKGPFETETTLYDDFDNSAWSVVKITRRDGVMTSRTTEDWSWESWGAAKNSVTQHLSAVDSSDDLLTTYYYHYDGRLKSVSRPDSSWTHYEYQESRTITTTPWLSSCSLIDESHPDHDPANGIYAGDLPPTGEVIVRQSSLALEQVSDILINETVTSYKDLSTEEEVDIAHSYSYRNRSNGKAYQENYRSGSEILTSYSLSYPSQQGALSGRRQMSWDQTGRATKYDYKRGSWTAANGFVDLNDPAGEYTRIETTEGVVSSPSENSGLGDFSEVAGRSSRSVTITGPHGVVQEEDHVHTGSAFELAQTRLHLYEAESPHRHLGVQVAGRYLSKTEYPSALLTRRYDQSGAWQEMLYNEWGELIRTSTSGSQLVPSVVTTFTRQGTTETTFVDNLEVSSVTRDLLGRTASQSTPSGGTMSYQYPSGGRTTEVTRPGGVTSVTTRHFDGHFETVSGTGELAMAYAYDVDVSTGFKTTTTTLGTSRESSVESNWFGSPVTSTSADPSDPTQTVSLSYQYDPLSRAREKVTPSTANTASQISSLPSSSNAARLGMSSLSGLETDDNGPVITSSDRLTQTEIGFAKVGNRAVRRTITKSFHTNDSSDALVSTTQEFLDPVPFIDPQYGLGLRWTSLSITGASDERTITRHRESFFLTATTRTSVSDSSSAPGIEAAVSLSEHGREVSSSAFGEAAPTLTTYDSSGRRASQVSSQGAQTSYYYNDWSQLTTMTDHLGNETSYQYYGPTHQNAGAVHTVTNAEDEVQEAIYNERGQILESTGNGAYRITYDYNEYGEMDEMRTYRDPTSLGDLTEWEYQPETGVLLGKADALSAETTYTYYSNGRLKTRKWARPEALATIYTYNPYGDLTVTDYQDPATHNVTVTPDRLGRPHIITDASGTRTRDFHPVSGALDKVTYASGGLLSSLQIDYQFDTDLRPTGYSVPSGPSSVLGYDDFNRLETVTSDGITHTHSYLPGTITLSGLVSGTAAAPILERNLYHDRMQRLRGIQTTNQAGDVVSRHGYQLDAVGRRKVITRENGQYWDIGYDEKGQVTSADKSFSDDTPMPGHSFSYDYDGIGNRTAAKLGGTEKEVAYTPNAVNQYDNIATERGRFILGEAPVTDNVQLNGIAVSRAGGFTFFGDQLTVADGSAQWSSDAVTNLSANPVETVSGDTWTPAASVDLEYDEDGNLESDGRWEYKWNNENRLIEMAPSSAALTAAQNANIPVLKLEFVYDSQGRRVSKTVSSSSNGSNWAVDFSRRFLYDGWNLIAEYSAPTATSSTLTLESSYTWGTDLSGTSQGAGGVGGLLCATVNQSSVPTACYPAYDGNGNISAWVDSAGSHLGKQEYSPFGQLITQYNFAGAASDIMEELKFGFSTKYTDEETGLCYYGYRYYDPVTGRWPSRDPIGEQGGVNLYGFVGNNAISRLDYLGLSSSIEGLVSRFVIKRQEPVDEFDEGDSGYGGFFYARYWEWSFAGKAKANGVAVSASSRGHITKWKGVFDYAYAYFDCNQDTGEIVNSSLRTGGGSSQGTAVTFASIDDISYPDKSTVVVKFSAGASYKGDVTPSLAPPFLGASFSPGVSGKSRKGQASFKCVCVYAKHGEELYTDG